MAKVTFKYFLILIGFSLFLTSCRIINPSQMFRTGSGYEYADFSKAAQITEYKLAPNDKLSFTIATNNGEKLIDPVNIQSATTQNRASNMLEYTIDINGMIKIPVIGMIKISDLTILEAEKLLEEKYKVFYNEPFVQIQLTNQRVFVFPGSINGTAQVLELKNSNTSLLEAIAEVGGIEGGKAHKIKLIRGNLKDPQVYLIDLSTIDGMKNANLILQANDIIYIESRDKLPSRALEAITPYLTLATTILLIIKIF